MDDRRRAVNELLFQLNSKEVKEHHDPIQLSVTDAEKILALLKEQEEKDEKILTALDGYRMCDEMSKNAYDNLTKLVKSEIGEEE